MGTESAWPPCEMAAQLIEQRASDVAAGYRSLASHLLDHCSLSADAKSLARTLLLVDGLQPLTVKSLDNDKPPPLVMWRRADNQQNAAIVELVLLDLGGVGGRAVVELPHDAIIASSYCRIFCCRAALCQRDHANQPPVSVCAAACDNVEPLVGFFSARELCNGQLHVRAPSNGVASLHVVAASTSIGSAVADADARVVRAHLLSALFRLGRRGREYASSNDAAKILAGCACADAEKSACRWRDLWARLHPVSAEMVEPLGRILWAGTHGGRCRPSRRE